MCLGELTCDEVNMESINSDKSLKSIIPACW
jgi:hypothetical protein